MKVGPTGEVPGFTRTVRGVFNAAADTLRDSTIHRPATHSTTTPSSLTKKVVVSTGLAGGGITGSSLIAAILEPITTASYNFAGIVAALPSVAIGLIHGISNAIELSHGGIHMANIIKRVAAENLVPATLSAVAGLETLQILSTSLNYTALSVLKSPGSFSTDSVIRYFGAYTVAGAVYFGLNRLVRSQTRRFWSAPTHPDIPSGDQG